LFVINTDISAAYTLSAPSADQIKIKWPDVVANLRVDQAWGSAQIMGAIHDASGGYYGSTLTGAEVNGHPENKIGFAVGGGIKINFPMIAPGDFFQMQVNYAQGATRYVGFTQNGTFNPFMFDGGTSVGFGLQSDAVYCGRNVTTNVGCDGSGVSEVQLTTAWGVNASYEHFWTPSLRTSLYGAYMKVSYNDTAKAIVCGNAPVSPGSGQWGGLSIDTNCNPGYSEWGFGSRTQWNVTKDFYMGVDVYYVKLQPEMSGPIVLGTNGAKPAGTYFVEDQDNVGTRIRFHRDIAP
jgi:hypothetical protein